MSAMNGKFDRLVEVVEGLMAERNASRQQPAQHRQQQHHNAQAPPPNSISAALAKREEKVCVYRFRYIYCRFWL